MKKYCIYIRVSTQRQNRSGLGLEAQMKICSDYINGVGGEVSKTFKDVESGTHRDRQGLWDALKYSKETGETLVIAKLDRLARDVEFTFHVYNLCKNGAFDIHFCDMPQVNTMILGMFSIVAQYERELTSKRTKDALAAKKAQGYKLGNPKGVDMSKAYEASAKARRDKAKNDSNNKIIWCIIGQTGHMPPKTEDLPKIAEQLNNMGIKTAKGLEFTPERVRTAYHNLKKIFR